MSEFVNSLLTYPGLAQAQADAPGKSFFDSTGFYFLLFVAAVALGLFLARTISTSLKLGEYRERMAVVLVTVLVASLLIWAKWPLRFGVDLRGGINMVGSLNLDAWAGNVQEGPPTAANIIPNLIRRVNPSGTKEIMIRPLGTDKIEVTIPSVDLSEANSIWDRLTKAGKLEFRILADAQYAEHAMALRLARETAQQGTRDREVKEVDPRGGERVVAYWSSLAREVPTDGNENVNAPFKFVPSRGHLVRDRATGRLVDITAIPLSNDRDRQGQELANWARSQNVRSLQVLLLQPEEVQTVEGKHLYRAASDIDEMGRACVSFTMTDEGAYRLGSFTNRNVNRLMGMVLDDQLHSAANINEAIRKNGRITGSFTQAEVDEIVINLRSGKLDVALNKVPISQNFINSTLGEELKQKGIWSIAISLALVLVFMLYYYRFLGVVSWLVLALNALLILALVIAVEQPLTLTGLAGLVLTIGMSVDANVLIFERIREELDRGAALRMAIRNGFDKAFSTIVDANVTTFITALVLYAIGTEQVKGFAVTLMFGILVSMFTAIYVARLILDVAERKRWVTSLTMMRLLEKKEWQFVNKVNMTSILSIALILIGIVGIYSLGSRILDQDLRGGSTARVVFNETQDIDDVRRRLSEVQMEVNGEKIDFTVAGFQGLNDDDTLANRQFKIDSNLQAWEGGPGERWEQLDEILDRIFAGQLKKNKVELVGVEASGSSETSPDVSWIHRSSPAAGIGQNLGPVAGSSHRRWQGSHWVSGLSLMSSASGMVSVFQDQDGAGQQDQHGEGQAEGQEEAQVEGDDQTGQESDKAEDQVTQFDPTVNTQTPEDNPQSRSNELAKVTRTLKFNERISGRGIRELLASTSEKINLAIDEDDIELNSPDQSLDQPSLGTESTEWTITMAVANPQDADKVLETWQQEFNQTTFFPTTSKVGSQIAEDARWQALGAMIASLIGVILYIWIRFQNLAFGLAAVVALIHDVLIVLGAIAISHWLAGVLGFLGIIEFKISLEIVAALLTVIGYSLNDTIVVFDRIREVRGKRAEITSEMIDQSISQTLSRTILTSATTFLVVFILYWFGGEAIHGFAFALCIGVIVGTYSSIFVASPALLFLMNTVGLNPGSTELVTE